MEETLYNLKDTVIERRQAWENAKDHRFPTSIFVCNRRIQKLNEAMKMIEELELVNDFTKIGR